MTIWCPSSAGSKTSNWLSRIILRPCNLLTLQALGVAERGSSALPAVLESGLVGWLISVSTIASGDNVSLTGCRFFLNFCNCLFPFLERNTSWQYAPSYHSCNTVGNASFFQDLLTFRILLVCFLQAFAFDPMSHHCADFEVYNFALKMG